MSFLKHIEQNNQRSGEVFYPFMCDGRKIGCVAGDVFDLCKNRDDVFTFDGKNIEFQPHLNDFNIRTEAMESIRQDLIALGKIDQFNELNGIVHQWGDQPLFLAARPMMHIFGFVSFGLHVNGYVQKEDGLYMWLGMRSKDVVRHPSLLDQIIAGGQPYGVTLEDNLHKEGEEEAGFSKEIMRRSKPVGFCSYYLEEGIYTYRGPMFVFDLELNEDEIPNNTDGEVEYFKLYPIKEVMNIVEQTDDIKMNCNLVLLDFFVRHGYITDNHPDYFDIVHGLRQKF